MSAVAAVDETHDAARRSWVPSANAPTTDFPVQNLPLGVARDRSGRQTAVVAIGEAVFDAGQAARSGVLGGTPGELVAAVDGQRLNGLLARPPRELTALRHALADLLTAGAADEERIRGEELLLAPEEIELLPPAQVGSFTDFYAGIHHARAASRILLGGDVAPNYRWVPIAYQSRASTIRASGAEVARPSGQLRDGDADPVFAPCRMLDFELELGFYVGAGTEQAEPVPVGEASEHIAGFCLLNDWSARDIQRWEMAPLGPFLSKSFATTVSPWVVTADALAPFRVGAMARASDDPDPLPHLDDPDDRAAGGLDVELAVWLRTTQMRQRGAERTLLLRSNARHLYWTPAQMLAHHTSGGCDLQSGDLIGTGTISGPDPEQLGSLLELTEDGRRPAELPGGERRGYLDDGDEVTFTGRCERDGFVAIGFGACTGTVVPTAGA